MSLRELYDKYRLDYSLADDTGFNPYYKKIESVDEDKLKIDDKSFIDLASNNYLGIANDPRIKDATHKAIDRYGVSLCATPIALGYSELYEQARNKIAEFVGMEDCIIYPTCYQANNGVFSAITTRDDVVIIDQYAHSSLIEGVRSTGCKVRPFLHNNISNLESILENCKKYKQRFVVTESVFSTEGSIAPLKLIVELCKKYDAIPIVDDSHGLGVIGKSGRGILEYAGIKDFPGLYTSSLGKAVGNLGGVICGKASLMEYMRYYSSHLVYSTALPPHILAGVLEAIRIIEEDFASLSKKLWQIRSTLVFILLENNFEVLEAKAPIISVLIGDEEKSFAFARDLFKNEILCTSFIYPSVPKGKAVIRLIPGANMKDESIKKFREAVNGMNYEDYR